MKHLLISFLTISILTGCQESPETKFEKNGISFTSPTGWKITDDENLDNQGYYLSIEKDGLNSSGLLIITWINDSLDLNEWLEKFIDKLENNIIYKNSNLTFETPASSEFNTIRSLSVSFDFNISGVKHEGIIHVFYGKDKTIAILKQEAIEDKKKNISGFDTIEQSFMNE
ncbi:MAG: hypothetical protein H7246_00675 [Phycisphaerae bacterium]|nr:hypothetical protein [Saprospiraceae bacterium]